MALHRGCRPVNLMPSRASRDSGRDKPCPYVLPDQRQSSRFARSGQGQALPLRIPAGTSPARTDTSRESPALLYPWVRSNSFMNATSDSTPSSGNAL
jgi:hypothetical protein